MGYGGGSLIRSRAVPRGSHRAGRGARWPVVGGAVAALAVVAFATWYLLTEGPLSPAAEFSFDFGKVGGSSVAERAPAADLQDAAEAVRETLDEMYTIGFVDPTRWRGGTFPDIYAAFTDEIEPKVRQDLANLSVGDDAPKIQTVDPISGRLSVRFLVNSELQLVGATARTTFAANATATSDGGPVAIQHQGTYYMAPVEETWLIRGYDVNGIVTRVTEPLGDPEAAEA